MCFHHFISQREEAEEDIARSRITEVGVAAQKRIRNSPSILHATNSDHTTLSRATQKRRRRALVDAARRSHGGTSTDDRPTNAGLFSTLMHTMPPEEMISAMSVSSTIQRKVLPGLVSPHVSAFNVSKQNTIRSLGLLYRGGIISKSKYEGVAGCNIRQYCARENRSKYLTMMNHVRLPCYLPYKQLMRYVRSQDIGELSDIPVVDGCRPVTGTRRSLRATVTAMADVFLSNRRLRRTLEWFGEENCFHFAIGGDGAPYGKADEDMTIWCVSFLNRGRRVGSPQDNFLLVAAQCKETDPAMLEYARHLDEEITQLEAQTITIRGRSCTFKCGMAVFDQKYLATVSGELPNNSTYFSSFGDVSNDNKSQVNGSLVPTCTPPEVNDDTTTPPEPNDDTTTPPEANNDTTTPPKPNDDAGTPPEPDDISDTPEPDDDTSGPSKPDPFIWRPWQWEERLAVVQEVTKLKATLSGNLESKTNRQKITGRIAELGSRQEYHPPLGKHIEHAKAEPLHLMNNAWQMVFEAVILDATSLSPTDAIIGNHPIGRLLDVVKTTMRLNRLHRQVKAWLEDKKPGSELHKYFRFTGNESRKCCHNISAILKVRTIK